MKKLNRQSFKGKKVTIAGLGKSGWACALFLHSLNARVYVTDKGNTEQLQSKAKLLAKKAIQTELGTHTESFIKGSDYLVVSPGVPENCFPVLYAKKHKIPIISEIKLGMDFCAGKVAAVTASNGKTTTCTLIADMFEKDHKAHTLCGNIGFVFLEKLPQIKKDQPVILEISSFQLEDSPGFRPHVSLILNISPNHLDRHKTFSNYVRAKSLIFKEQDKNNIAIFNYDDPVAKKLYKKARCRKIWISKKPIPALVEQFFILDDKIFYRKGRAQKVIADIHKRKLIGQHNLDNLLGASAVAYVMGVKVSAIEKSISSFKTLSHRIEKVRDFEGVSYVDDSKSTTIESTKAAISSCAGSIILIAGGRDKSGGFEYIRDFVKKHVKKVVLYGEARELIAKAWASHPHIETIEKFSDAVKRARAIAAQSDTVLLSPMCTSFDQFNSYAHRGETFQKMVKQF